MEINYEEGYAIVSGKTGVLKISLTGDCKQSYMAYTPLGGSEPKRINRWLMTFPSKLEIPQWTLQDSSRPSMVIKPIKILGIPIPFTKKIYWQPFNIQFKDPIKHSIAKAIYSCSSNPYNKLDKIELEMLDPTGVPIELWELTDCEILSVNYGALHYDSDELAIVTMRIQPKTCKLIY